MAEASIRIKLGQIEVEYQGDASFLKKDLLETVKELLELQKKEPLTAPLSNEGVDTAAERASADKYHHSTDTIANLTGANREAAL